METMTFPETGATTISIDEFAVLQRGREWVALSDMQAALAAALIASMGAVVGTARLLQAAWPAGTGTVHALGSQVHRLRTKLEPLGFEICNVRGRGFLMERARGALRSAA